LNVDAINDDTIAIPLIGYCDTLSARPGDRLDFKVSSRLTSPFQARLVRVISADPNPDGPGIIEHPVATELAASYPSREQPFYPGSSMQSESPLPLSFASDLSIQTNIWPTLRKSANQIVLAWGILEVGINASGCVYAAIGDQIIQCEQPLQLRQWYQCTLTWQAARQQLTIHSKKLNTRPAISDTAAATFQPPPADYNAPVCIAARTGEGKQTHNHFNGKIESPSIRSDQNQLIAHWDFACQMGSLQVPDTGPLAVHGKLINMPVRAMTASNWDGSEMCWRYKPEQYAAIHFHEDDIIDFDWQTDFSYTIPDDLPSGIYAMRISAEGHEDAMPFFVCPPKGQRTADLAVLVSTFTYSVYGNHARPDFKPAWKDHFKAWNAYPYNPAEYPEYGLSTYNYHTDGSGICHASHRRPLFNLKPGYLTFGYGPGSGLRHFQADSHLIAWLHAKDIAYDIITDDELHATGSECLAGYKTLTTGSHPEYHTPESLNTLQHFRDSGGNFMYLGGNGFYWRVALHKEQTGAIEIRRAEGGIRAWAAEPGEYYHAFDGQYGGLWRRNGRPPQALPGIGFSAQGQFEGTYYRRSALSYDDKYNWIFKGVNEEIIGDFGLSGGGAAGFELDRADPRLGSPQDIAILASSEVACDSFVLVPEEQLTHITTWSGEPIEDLLRADMVYFEVPGGGKVFASGSITFCGSLPSNNFDNNISTIVGNVLTEFLSDGK